MKTKLVILLGFLLPTFSQADVLITNFDRLMVMVCSETDVAAAARMQIDAAQQRVDTSKLSAWMPDVTLGVDVYAAKGQPTSFFAVQDGAVQDPEEPNFYQKGEAWLGKVDMTWGLYDEGYWLGEGGLNGAETQAELNTAKAQLSAAQREAIKLISQYYFDTLMYSAQIDILTPLVAKREFQLEEMETKIAAGINTTDDLYTAKSAYLSLYDQLMEASRLRDINKGYLEVMTDTRLNILNTEKDQGLEELASILEREVILGEIQQVVNLQPDVSLLQSKLDLEYQKLEAQNGKLKPNLNLYVKLRTGDNFDNGLRKDYGEVGLSFSYPLGSVPSHYGEAKAIQRSIAAIDTELQYLQKIKMLQARNISGNLESAKRSIGVAKLDLERREQLLLSEIERVNSGLASLDELVQSEDDKINSQLSLLGRYRDAWMEYIDAALFLNTACIVAR
jgi:outer membrane protein TolC